MIKLIEMEINKILKIIPQIACGANIMRYLTKRGFGAFVG